MTNKLLEIAPKNNKRLVTVEDLENLAAELNGEVWVQRLGRHYSVKREPNPKFKPGSLDHKEREFTHTLAWSG